ncbi:hypothetical protein GCM10010145_61520 [Streptomyces ruber]|uniref:Uncharacterized protein n=2 Tax=Streptomyces TaxID=1883 RepID=A0A918BRQ6_9ACTN|nr:hypothetical protein GCM10010145_61520 [Streptomyces ruber]
MGIGPVPSGQAVGSHGRILARGGFVFIAGIAVSGAAAQGTPCEAVSSRHDDYLDRHARAG